MEYFLFPRFDSLRADNCGCAILSPGWTHPRRLLGSSVLIVGIRGRVPLLDGEGERAIEHEIAPGTVVLLPAGRIHFGTSPITMPVMYYWFHFSLSTSPSIITQSSCDTIFCDADVTAHYLDNAALLPLHFNLRDPEPFYQSFRDLLFEQEHPSYTDLKFQIMFQSLLIRLTECAISSHRPERVGIGKSSVTYSVITWMSEHLTDSNLSIKTIANAVGLNPDYVGRRFREVMGLAVGEYLLKKRIELAICQLQETNDTIATIAQNCGFGTVRHFLRQFKAEEGVTPTEVRKRFRMMHVNVL